MNRSSVVAMVTCRIRVPETKMMVNPLIVAMPGGLARSLTVSCNPRAVRWDGQAANAVGAFSRVRDSAAARPDGIGMAGVPAIGGGAAACPARRDATAIPRATPKRNREAAGLVPGGLTAGVKLLCRCRRSEERGAPS